MANYQLSQGPCYIPGHFQVDVLDGVCPQTRRMAGVLRALPVETNRRSAGRPAGKTRGWAYGNHITSPVLHHPWEAGTVRAIDTIAPIDHSVPL